MTKLAISRIHPLSLAKVLALVYAALGLFVGGLIAGALYNLAVRLTGGVVIETSSCE